MAHNLLDLKLDDLLRLDVYPILGQVKPNYIQQAWQIHETTVDFNNFFHLLGNDVVSTRIWKRGYPKNPVPKRHMYAIAVTTRIQT